MSGIRPGPFDRDAAQRARQRMEGRGKRRLAKQLLERNAQWRRLVLKTMLSGLAAMLAGQLLCGELAAAQPGAVPASQGEAQQHARAPSTAGGCREGTA